ncbi:MAG: SMI1/KNR4 family protein [Micromonosporaceae bacterium]
MATIEELVRLVPPPAVPVAADGDWGAVEATLGLRLPADYRALVTRYGVGDFDDITLLSPFAPAHHGDTNLVVRARALPGDLELLRREFPESVPYPLFPEPGGALTWAVTGNADLLSWLTGEESWPIVLWNIRDGWSQRYECGAVELLHGHFSGRRTIEAWGTAPREPWFDPYRERVQVYLRLAEGDRPYPERLRILRDALAPTADRGSYTHDGRRQDHFKAVDRDWLVTYETMYGHQLRVAFPAGDEPAARRTVRATVAAMGCRVLSARALDGTPIWA